MRQLDVAAERWALAVPVVISGYSMPDPEPVVVTLRQGEHVGRGEGLGVYYHNDTPARLIEQIESVRLSIEAGAGREKLLALLPPGGARNALDCALWDLEAKLSGIPVHIPAGMDPPRPLRTTYTLAVDTPGAMAERARGAYRDATAIKIKLAGEPLDAARIRAIRAARPDVWLGVDANQGYSRERLIEMLPLFADAGVSLIEQPCKIGSEGELDGLKSKIPFAADESVQSLGDISDLVGRFQVVNIKLDKCGGLTEALRMVKRARALGLGVMVGNMGGTSLAMAPALLVGQLCDLVDLDGPLFLGADRVPGVIYEHGFVSAPPALWGWPV